MKNRGGGGRLVSRGDSTAAINRAGSGKFVGRETIYRTEGEGGRERERRGLKNDTLEEETVSSFWRRPIYGPRSSRRGGHQEFISQIKTPVKTMEEATCSRNFSTAVERTEGGREGGREGGLEIRGQTG